MWRAPLGVALWQRKVEKMTGDSGGAASTRPAQGWLPGIYRTFEVVRPVRGGT